MPPARGSREARATVPASLARARVARASGPHHRRPPERAGTRRHREPSHRGQKASRPVPSARLDDPSRATQTLMQRLFWPSTALLVVGRRPDPPAIHDPDAVCVRLGQLRAGRARLLQRRLSPAPPAGLSALRLLRPRDRPGRARRQPRVDPGGHRLERSGRVQHGRPGPRAVRPGAGLLAGLLLACTVGFWGYGEVAYPYVALAGETATLAWLAHSTLAGRRGHVVWLGCAWAVAAGVRWDAAVFCGPLWLWAWCAVSWRLRAASIGVAAVVVAAWAVPMIQLTGGLGRLSSGAGELSAGLVGSVRICRGRLCQRRRHAGELQPEFLDQLPAPDARRGAAAGAVSVWTPLRPARLAADQRSRFLGLWIVPPLLVYVYAHLGESGYVLSLAPQAAILIAIALLDLGADVARAAEVVRARGWRWVPRPRLVGATVSVLLGLAIVGWNVQAFARGVGPGRLPDLRAHDATTSAQVEFLRQQPAATTLVLAHDILRQLAFYAPGPRVELLYSEYVPDFANARTRTELPAGHGPGRRAGRSAAGQRRHGARDRVARAAARQRVGHRRPRRARDRARLSLRARRRAVDDQAARS